MKTRHIIIALAVVFIVLNVFIVGGVWFLRRGVAPTVSSLVATRSVLLVSPEGRHYLGDQLGNFTVDQEGVIGATNTAWFSLYYTEGKPFRLSGEVWLADPSARARVQDLPDGFALFIREWDSLHRYSLTTRSVEVKRRLRGGLAENAIIPVASFKPPAFETWIPFTVEVSGEGLGFRIGEQSGTIPGPLDVDGANKIALTAGTRLRNVRLEMLAR